MFRPRRIPAFRAATPPQRSNQEAVAAAAEHDAAEHRLTELYTRAVELLGSDNAAVRLGGLHALERLGQDNPGQRPTIVAVLCAYLRMPPADDRREGEVRRTAQRVLTRHLRADGDHWWPGVSLDLTGARLEGFDAAGCTLVDADRTGAVCTGATRLTGGRVSGRLYPHVWPADPQVRRLDDDWLVLTDS